MSGAEIITFGCRLNAYESEVMRGHARAAGLDDAVIVNTCAVTAEAERQARQAIRRARRRRPDARIVVTGCGAQIDPARYAAMPEVDRVLGNSEKLAARSFLPEARERVAVNDIMSVRETASHLITGFEGRTRAFVQVQNGCDHRCTFCVIPYGRGNSRSVPLGEVVAQVRALVEQGYRELVLTGVDLGAYGADLPGRPSFGQAVRRILDAVPELARLRLSSVDPVETDDALEALIADEPRLMPHLHLSVQAGDDLTLKRMKRRHTRDDVLRLCDRLRALRPGIVFGADLIAGFPTESDAMFENTLRLVEEAELTWLHVFSYSSRPGTPAARMPQLPGQVRRERAARLRAAGEASSQRLFGRLTGEPVRVLIEQDNAGRSEHYAPVRVPGARLEPGAIIEARVSASTNDHLIATAA